MLGNDTRFLKCSSFFREKQTDLILLLSNTRLTHVLTVPNIQGGCLEQLEGHVSTEGSSCFYAFML